MCLTVSTHFLWVRLAAGPPSVCPPPFPRIRRRTWRVPCARSGTDGLRRLLATGRQPRPRERGGSNGPANHGHRLCRSKGRREAGRPRYRLPSLPSHLHNKVPLTELRPKSHLSLIPGSGAPPLLPAFTSAPAVLSSRSVFECHFVCSPLPSLSLILHIRPLFSVLFPPPPYLLLIALDNYFNRVIRFLSFSPLPRECVCPSLVYWTRFCPASYFSIYKVFGSIFV